MPRVGKTLTELVLTASSDQVGARNHLSQLPTPQGAEDSKRVKGLVGSVPLRAGW